MKNTTVALIVVIAILGGFYTGWKYSQSKVSATPAASTTAGGGFAGAGATGGTGGAGASGAGGTFGGGGGGGGFGGGNTVSGPIVAVGSGFITVHDRTTDKDVKIAYTPTVRIVKTDTASVADLTQNTTVTVIGQPGSDGTVDASAITIGNIVAFAGGGRGRPSPSPSS